MRAAIHASLLLALVASPAAAASAPAPLSLAVVVGANRSPSPTLDALRYADDDAINNARALRLLGIRTTLLVTPDAETRELLSDVRPDGPATFDAVRAAARQALAELRIARDAGRRTAFYIMFAGHGDVDGGHPFLQLDDGRLWRGQLGSLLQDSKADANHVILDACQGSLFVSERGAGGERTPVLGGFSQWTGFATNTGVLAARGSGGLTHEWEQFQGGVFSHEVRSGILGAADADLDGRITYRELASFVRQANAAIPNRRFRPDVSPAPPGGDDTRTLIETPTVTPRSAEPGARIQLDIDGTLPGRYSVETEHGVRLADFHAAPRQAVRLVLPPNAGPLYVQRVAQRVEYRIEPRAGRVVLAELAPTPVRYQARGAAHESFSRIFTLAFDRDVVASYRPRVMAEADLAPQPSAFRRWAPRILLGGGAALVATATAVGVSTRFIGAKNDDGVQRAEVGQQIEGRRNLAWGLGGLGGAAIATGLGLLWWEARF